MQINKEEWQHTHEAKPTGLDFSYCKHCRILMPPMTQPSIQNNKDYGDFGDTSPTQPWWREEFTTLWLASMSSTVKDSRNLEILISLVEQRAREETLEKGGNFIKYHEGIQEERTRILGIVEGMAKKFPERESDEYDTGYRHALENFKQKIEE